MHLELAHIFVFVELIIGDMIFLINTEKRKYFFLRLIVSILCCFIFLTVWPFKSQIIEMFYYFFLFLFTLFVIYFSYILNIWDTLYWGISGLIIQHTGYSICTIFWSFKMNYKYSILIVILVYTLLYIFIYVFIVHNHKEENHTKDNQKILLLISALVVCITVFLNSFRSIFLTHENQATIIINSIYSLICCILSFLLLFGFFEQTKLQNELRIIKNIWKNEKVQFTISKKNFELLNIYCHDIKALKSSVATFQQLDSYKKEFSDKLFLLDTTIVTNNHALDIILTEKAIECHQKNIEFTCMADGNQLNFLKTTDIYSIFNNLLNNAIEAVSNITIQEKRIISLVINYKNNFAYIHIENYFIPPLVLKKGFPKTSKLNKELHGYGLKSISLMLKQYNGHMSIETNNNIFYINIIIPLSEKS